MGSRVNSRNPDEDIENSNKWIWSSPKIVMVSNYKLGLKPPNNRKLISSIAETFMTKLNEMQTEYNHRNDEYTQNDAR
jgi:hypothetical protein